MQWQNKKNDRFWPKPDYRMFTTSRLLQSFLKATLTINPRHLKLFQFNSKITSKTTGRITSSQVNLVLLSLALLYLSLVIFLSQEFWNMITMNINWNRFIQLRQPMASQGTLGALSASQGPFRGQYVSLRPVRCFQNHYRQA